MKRFDTIAFAKNVASSWLRLAVNVATGIVISPYILHRLGNEAFGLWALVFSVSGYYGLFDLGIRSSVVRYVAKFSATEEQEAINRVVNTSLFSYSFIFLAVSAITIITSISVVKLIHVHPGYAYTARALFLMVGLSLAVGFPLGVFAGILEGLQEFYLVSSINIASTLLRAVLVILALNHGYGLLTVAMITVLLPTLSQLGNGIAAIRLAHIRLGWRFVSLTTFRQLLNYGSLTFIVTVAENLRFRTDEVVIGSVLSAAAIAPFAIGARIVDYATGIVDSLAQVFTPMSTHFDTRGELSKLRFMLVAGNRGCALVIFPVGAGLAVLGKSVIQLWMGPRYVSASYPVLLILLFACTVRMSQATSGRILFGMARHQWLAGVVLVEGIINLLLSIPLTYRYGIAGCALGTAIPMIFTYVVFLPAHTCRVLGVSLRSFLAEAYTAPLLLCLPLVMVLLTMHRWFAANTWLSLGAYAVVSGVVYTALVYYFMFVKGPHNARHEPAGAAPREQVILGSADQAAGSTTLD